MPSTSPFDVRDLKFGEKLKARLEADAEAILEQTLHRTRWLVKDRDALADELRRIVWRELRQDRSEIDA
ncbi:hypothetical protein [Frigidibacter sp. MR17.24]|uniref:hypothetical protein n=1 Tax=Frigidibacter sp. MR17.24 TaxID=3127345 RepID=UPI003012B000